jgi:hypothetical protein
MWPGPLKEQVDAAIKRGLNLEVCDVQGQYYVVVRGVHAPVPPWDRSAFDIAIAIPAAYDQGSLDAFYLALPYKFNNGEHKRVQGGVIRFKDQDWKLVSWHYLDGKPWVAGLDSLETHITHCQGFFLHRGVKDAP